MTYTANGVANTARFVYDSFGEPRGFILNDSATYLYLKNGQGDITAIIGETGEILVRYEYNAWGAVEFVVPFGVDPAVTSTLATVSPFTYRGYCYDYDIGMYYLQSRYYDPQICRFINADSTDYLGATGTVLSYNLFAYCENDGVDYVDETGYKKKSKNTFTLKSDWAGKLILKNYLIGGGKTRVYKNKQWANYMKANYLLKLYVSAHLTKKYSKIKKNSSQEVNDKIHMEIDHGEGIIGYQYLHGTNSTVGGFRIRGVVSRGNNNKITFKLLYIWNDIIDINKKYPTDVIKNIFAEIITLGKATPYIIRIHWNDTSVYSKTSKGGWMWTKGWLKR